MIVSDFFAVLFTVFAREMAGDEDTLVVQQVAKECVIEGASGSRYLIGQRDGRTIRDLPSLAIHEDRNQVDTI